MTDGKDRERLEALRQKLYERGQDASFTPVRHQLSATRTVDVARGWGEPRPVTTVPPEGVVVAPTTQPVSAVPSEPDPVAETAARPRRRYRLFILLSSVAVFILAMAVTSVYLFFGGNQISGKNIEFVMTGPVAVAGGGVMDVQVAVTNNNAVAIEGATLIVSYPTGSKTVEESPRDLYQERLPLDVIAPGETKTLALKAAVFGEENEPKEIVATIEYRVAGSNGTFVKEADPLAFTINSSPVVLNVATVEKISSGQEFDITLTIQSNSPTPLKNILVSAVYPDSFTFISAKPEPSYRQTEWVIDNLTAQGSYEITIRGSASGLSSEAFLLRFQAGTPRSDNQYLVGSILAQNSTVLTVEQPFVAMKISVAGDSDGDVVLPLGSDAEVVVSVTNTHTEPVYDMTLRVSPEGTAFNEDNLRITDGFYSSVNRDIRWEVSGRRDLATVLPGQQRDFYFRINAGSDLRAATLDLSANVYARRVNEANVSEELIGSTEGLIRFSSVASLERQIEYGTGTFLDEGPVPPRANERTTYTLTLVAQAGANDMSGTVVSAQLPQYVEWLGKQTEGKVEYNPVNKEVWWDIGELKGGERRTLSFQVAFTPSVLQVNQAPIIMGQQQLRATDRFTGTPLQAFGAPITTELSTEAGYGQGSGDVQPAQ